jgi:hypothetical protein
MGLVEAAFEWPFWPVIAGSYEKIKQPHGGSSIPVVVVRRLAETTNP